MSDPSRLAQLNRLKAKEALRASALSRQRSASPPRSAKAPEGAKVDGTSRDAATKQGDLAPLEPDKRLGKYFDYDLSKMVNSRGGFLVEDPEALGEKAAIEKKRREERAKAQGRGAFEPGIDVERGPRCRECGTVEIEHKFMDVFGVAVCNSCKRKNEDKYSLLTKSECKEDYLLTDDELKDEELLPHLLKANPHGGTFSNMMLFLRMQVETYAFKKWGGADGLDEEYERREEEKRERKERKFQKGLRLLRSRTRNNPYQNRLDAEHVHEFALHRDEGLKRCEECGFEVEVEVL